MQNRFPALVLIVALLLCAPLPAAAQEAQPGDACTAGELHHMRQTSGPENPGTGYFLVCDGANWKLITEWDTATGSSLFQVDYDPGACDALKEARLRYTSASDLWEYCDGANWTDLTSGGGLWNDSGAGYIEYSSALGGMLIAGVTGQPAPNIIGVTNLNDLGDVSVASPDTGDVLTWDGADWIAGAGAAGDFAGLTDTPADYSGAANKIVAVNGSGNALVFTDEADPQVGTLTNGKWCTTDGSVITCSQDAPAGDNLGNHTATQALAMATFKITGMGTPTAGTDAATKAYVDGLTGANEVDPKISTLTNGKWCTTDGNVITCSQDAPAGDNLGNHTATQALAMATFKITGMGTPTAGTDAATKAYVDGLTGANEVDPKISTLTNGKWCTTNGSVVTCTADAPAGDNLGNHTATANLKMSGFWLSNDGGNEGVFVDAAGNVGIGVTDPETALDVNGAIQVSDRIKITGTTGLAPPAMP